MASRWRIRHKLLLGLGLVVLLMTVLLSGTLRGLWAYYTTTNSIRGKLHELFAAEQLKASVGELVSRENTEEMVKHPATVDAEIRKVRDNLETYSEKLGETLAHSYDSRRGLYEREVIAGLHGNLDEYQQAIDQLITPGAVSGGDEVRRQNNILKLAKPRATLTRGSVDLRDHIKMNSATDSTRRAAITRSRCGSSSRRVSSG